MPICCAGPASISATASPERTRVCQPSCCTRCSNQRSHCGAATSDDAIGICWFLREIDGVPTVGHGGSTNGQFAELLLVPERDFAVVALANAGPDGIPFNQEIVRWALENYLGLVDRDPEPPPYDETRAREIVGTYENDVMTLTIRIAGGAGLRLEVRIQA